MNKPRIGIVGLGGIAQKVYLPILTKENDWILAGAYTRNQQKKKQICQSYRVHPFEDLKSVSDNCDAVFLHTSTETHFEIVRYFLQQGKDVYVDKPLAASIEEAETLVDLSLKHNRKLMVGFNRRFAPFYQQVKQSADQAAWIRMEKHRINSIGPDSFQETMYDDYIHLIDTARWLGGNTLTFSHGVTHTNSQNQLDFAHHAFSFQSGSQIFTGMHRDAGTGSEVIELVGPKRVIRVKNIDTLETEEDGQLITSKSGSWETILEEKGFTGAVHHFIHAIINNEEPAVNGTEGLHTQILLEKLIKETS